MPPIRADFTDRNVQPIAQRGGDNGADPNQLQKSDKKLAEMGFMAEYLEGLPYHSEVLNLDEQTWKAGMAWPRRNSSAICRPNCVITRSTTLM